MILRVQDIMVDKKIRRYTLRLKLILLISICCLHTSLMAKDLIRKVESDCEGYYIGGEPPLYPFSPVTELEFGVFDSADVTIEIHRAVEYPANKEDTTRTEMVKQVYKGALDKGIYIVTWDRTDSEGNKVEREHCYVFFLKVYRKVVVANCLRGYVYIEAKHQSTGW